MKSELKSAIYLLLSGLILIGLGMWAQPLFYIGCTLTGVAILFIILIFH